MIPKHSPLIFITGAVILGLELTASRYMAPMFGSSLYIWGAILAVTLLCLSGGYSLGGKLGDRLEFPVNRLVLFVLVCAAWIGILPFVQRPVAELGMASGMTFGPLLVMAVLFATPILLLATATPIVFADDNRQKNGAQPAGTIGNLFAISTIGSVIGALITAYLLIPRFGLKTTLFILAATLVVAIVPYAIKGIQIRTATNVVFIIAAAQFLYEKDTGDINPDFSLIHHESTRYSELSVLEESKTGSRVLLLDGTSQNWVNGEQYDHSIFEYTDVMLAQLSQFNPQERRALVLGLGAGTLPRNLRDLGWQVDTVEIDPDVYRIAQGYFNFPKDLAVHLEDARTFLNKAGKKNQSYGLIALDVAGGGGQPGHLFNLESFQLMRELLGADGVLIINQLALISENEDAWARHTLATLESLFPLVRAFDVYPAEPDGFLTNLVTVCSFDKPQNPMFRSRMQETVYDPDLDGVRLLSDNWNPANVWSVQLSTLWHDNIRQWLGLGVLIPI